MDLNPVGMECLCAIGIADVANRLAYHLLVVDGRVGSDLAGKNYLVVLAQHFAGNPAALVLCDVGIENGVRSSLASKTAAVGFLSLKR